MNLKKNFLTFVMFDFTGKIGPQNFSAENNYFLKCLFLSTSEVPKKRWYLLHNNCQKTSWTPIKCCSLVFWCSIKAEKTGHKVFSIGKDGFFFSKVCVFINLLGHKKIWSYYFHSKHSKCHKTLCTLINGSLRFLILDNTRKNGQIIFSSGKFALFFKKLSFQQPLRS